MMITKYVRSHNDIINDNINIRDTYNNYDKTIVIMMKKMMIKLMIFMMIIPSVLMIMTMIMKRLNVADNADKNKYNDNDSYHGN